ncbi:beta-ketoacyl-ACP synthase III [Capnocytophaga sp. oral taxon 338]|uniref:beta-ketoacyl-ACP synthase III n=1 Tax=Capnocytophaga sp. oral taxon 338 TaxID=710239 RepID=UPI000202E4B0|nr:beta-ketoacyl-ACP synthase III [Capnocytophaga sp. oral taxon 338]EGD34835.1 3-oxoacyl-(acyl-carrier-protein) synthase III [Capnocytophaga sp. oral taxon 338 str. F0234]
MNQVYITKASKYLPNAPVNNEQMELFLGKIQDSTSKAKRIVLRNNGIQTRYYALDPQGNPTHTNASLTCLAIENLFDNHFSLKDIEVLSCGTSTPDCLLPSHAAMVHGLLKGQSVELNSSAGVCNSGMNALKFGYLSVKAGNSINAVCTGSERVSAWLRSDKYETEIQSLILLEEHPIIAFQKDFLRFMLSDGAGAFLLENVPHPTGTSLRIEWMEAFSYAHQLEACMYAGGEKQADGSLKAWSDYTPEQWLEQSIFAIKQDVKLLNENILLKGAESMHTALCKHALSADEVTYFLPHISSNYFRERLYEQLKKVGINIPLERWFMNLTKVGNVGSASPYLMLEELMNSGNLKQGDTLLLSVPESGRFSYSYAFLRVM